MEIGGSTKMAYEKNKDKLYINSFCLAAEAAMVAEWWGGGVVGGNVVAMTIHIEGGICIRAIQ